MIIDGRAIAEEIKQSLKKTLRQVRQACCKQAQGKKLRLDIVWVGDDLASAKYIERKKKFGVDLGIEIIVHKYPADVLEQDLSEEIEKLSRDEKIKGIIIQLPLPKQIDQEKILNLISREKDVDALSEETKVLSPVVGAIKEIFERYNISLKNKKAVVIGQGKLVGRPVAIWLTQEGANVEVVDINTKNSKEKVNQADIIISGAGKPGLITSDQIKDGVVLIDAGTSEQNGRLAGDADPTCALKCSLFTPVPGGIGPLTVAMLFKNLLELNK